MRQFNPHLMPPVQVRACPKCSQSMFIVRIEPTGQPGYDKRTFECSRCEHAEELLNPLPRCPVSSWPTHRGFLTRQFVSEL